MARSLSRPVPTTEQRLEVIQTSVNDLAQAGLIAPWDKRFRLAMAGYLFDLVSSGVAADAAQATLMALQFAVRSDPLDAKLYAMAAVLYWRLGQCPEGDDALVKYKNWGKPARTQVAQLERERIVGCVGREPTRESP